MSNIADDEYPDTEEVLNDPHDGDLLCFNGKEWKVARRDGWHYPVPPADKPKPLPTTKTEG